jgi:hypothetical protein
MIVYADTVIDPRTVMVKSFYAFVADSAVLASWCANNLALGTQFTWMNFR